MGEYEDAIDRLREEGLDGEAAVFEKYTKNQLREKAGRADTAERRAQELEAEIEALRAAPKREEALRKAGVDLARMRAEQPAAVEIIESQRLTEGKEYDEDWAKALVEKYKLPVVEGVGTEETEPPNAAQFGQPGGPSGITSKGNPASTTLKPLEVNSWDTAKRMRFIEWCDKNGKMDVYESLLRGETVTGITWPG